MTDLAKLGLALEATPMLSGLQAVDKALDATAARAEKLVATIKTATGQMAAAFKSVGTKDPMKEMMRQMAAAETERTRQAIANQRIQLNSALMTGRDILAAHKKRLAEEVASEKAAAREMNAIDAARAKQAMQMRMQPILSTGSHGLPTATTSAFATSAQAAPLYTASGIASVDKMRESLAKLRIEEDALHVARNAGRITHLEYTRSMDGITKATNLAVAGNTRARGSFRQMASAVASATFEITGAVYGLGAAAAILASPAVLGFKLLSTLEQTKLGMAAILVSMGEINGEAVKLPVALQVAAGMTQRVQENALKYGVSIRALADTTRSIMAPGLGAGLQLKEIEKIALAGSIAVKTIGLDSRQSVQEIRDLVAGGIQAASSTLARSLGINDKMVKEWTKAGTLYENLMTRLAGFQDTAILNTETLSGAWEIFAQKIQLAFANSEAFDMFKQKLIDISNWIGKVDVNSGKFKFNEDVVNSVTSYYESFKVTLDVLSEVGKVLALLKPVIQTIASLIVNAIYVVRMFAGEVKTMATQLVALAHLDFKNFKLIGSDWEKESKAARVEVDRLTRSILGLKEAQAGSSKLLGKWGIGAASPWSKVDPALFIRGKNTATGEDPTGKGRAKADPIKAFIDALKKEAETMGMGEIALKRYEAAKLGLKGKTKELADALINQIDKQRDALAAAKESNAASEEAMKAEDERIKAMEDLIAAQGVETSKLQFEASLIGKSNEERYISIGLHEAEVKGLQLSGAALDQYTTMLEKQYNLQKRISDEGKLTSLLSNTDVVKTKELYENVRLLDDAYFKLGSTMSDAQYAQAMKDLLGSTKDAVKELDTFAENAAKNIQDSMAEFLFNPFDKGLKGMAQGFGTMIQKMIAEAVAADLARKLFGGLTDKGKTSGSGLFGDILGAFGSFMGLANGGAFGPGGNVQAFASGGIMGPTGGMLNQPTIFPMGNGGIGIGGEAGVEAVMPLKRGPDGKLGVSAGNGGSTNITVIVQGGQSAPDVRRAAGQGAREALGLLNGARRYG